MTCLITTESRSEATYMATPYQAFINAIESP